MVITIIIKYLLPVKHNVMYHGYLFTQLVPYSYTTMHLTLKHIENVVVGTNSITIVCKKVL